MLYKINANNIKINVLTKLFMLLSTIISAFCINLTWSSFLLFVILLVMYCVQGYYLESIRYGIAFIIISILINLSRILNVNELIFSKFYFFMIWKMIPIFMVISLIVRTSPGEIISMLQKIKVPNSVTLMIVVAFRYTPTIKAELTIIKEAMKCRGIKKVGLIKNPLNYVESFLVPLLTRSLNIADELTVSAITRGSEAPVKRYSYYSMKFTKYDGIVFCVFLLTNSILLWFGGCL